MSELDYSSLVPVSADTSTTPATPAATPAQASVAAPTAAAATAPDASAPALDYSSLKPAVVNPQLDMTFKMAPDDQLAPVAKQYELHMSQDLNAPFSLSAGTMPDNGLAFHIGRLMSTGDPQSAADVFLKAYPQGSLKSVDDTLVFRPTPDAPYQRVGGSAGVGSALVARNIIPTLSVVASPEIGAVGKGVSLLPKVGPKILALASKFPVVASALRFGGETSAGSIVDSAVNYGTGPTEDTDPLKEVSKASTSGTVAALTGLGVGAVMKTPGAVFAAGRLVKNLFTGEATQNASNWLSNFIMKTADPDLMKFSSDAQEAGLNPLNQGQVGHPMARVIAGQVGAVSSALHNSGVEQLDSLRQSLQGVVDSQSDAGVQTPVLQKLVATQLQEISAMAPIANKLGVSDLGDALQTQVDATVKNTRQLVSNKMSDAAALAGDKWIAIPTQPLKDAAVNILQGVHAPGMDGEPPVQLQEIPGVIRTDLNKIAKLGPNFGTIEVGGKTDDAFTQFMTMRDNWYDLMTSSPDPNVRVMAGKLWDASMGAVNQSLSELSGRKAAASAGAAFTAAKDDALNSFKSYTATRQMLNGIMQSNTPGRLADTLVQPGRAPILDTIAQTGGMGIVSDGFRSKLFNDLPNAEKTITKLQVQDPRVINSVIPPDEQQAWIDLSRKAAAINKSTTNAVSAGEESPVANAVKIAGTASKSEIDRFTNATGGYSGPYATGLRHGIFSDVLSNLGNPAAFGKAVDNWTGRAAELSNVLSPADINMLSMFKRYAEIPGVGGTKGVSSYGGLSAGSQGKVLYDIAGLFKDRAKFGMTILNLVNKDAMARILARPASQVILMQAIKQGPNKTGLQLLSRAIGLATGSGLRVQSDNQYNQPALPPVPVWHNTGASQ